MICRNGRTRNRLLLLQSTRVVRGQVNSQAPNVSDCWSNLKQNVCGATDEAATTQYSGYSRN